MTELPEIVVCEVNLFELCNESGIDTSGVDWSFFPRETSFVVNSFQTPKFATIISVFSHNETKFGLHLFLPLLGASCIEPQDIKAHMHSMLAAMMRKRDFNAEFMKDIEIVHATCFYGGYYKFLVNTNSVGEFSAMRSTLSECIDAVCLSVRNLTTYHAALDIVEPDGD